jgi:hypothetical protein
LRVQLRLGPKIVLRNRGVHLLNFFGTTCYHGTDRRLPPRATTRRLVTQVHNVSLIKEEGSPSCSIVESLQPVRTSLSGSSDEDERMSSSNDWRSQLLDVYLTNLDLTSRISDLTSQLLCILFTTSLTLTFVYSPPT